MNKFISFLQAPLSRLNGSGAGQGGAPGYQRISQAEAWQMMQEQKVLVLDVREQGEYDSGHIPGAVLLPVGRISAASAAAVIPDKTATVLVYCRSGSRSRTAAGKLAELGYTGIYEFGGIITWPYAVE